MKQEATVLPAEGIGRLLKEQRKRMGFNQKHVVEKTGYSQTYISQIESGKKEPILSLFVDYCLAIGIAPNISFQKIK